MTKAEARAQAESIATVWMRTGGSLACNSTVQDSRPAFILPITGRQCLSCVGIGYLSRQTASYDTSQETSLLLLAPLRDSAVLCDFVRIERIRAGAGFLDL